MPAQTTGLTDAQVLGDPADRPQPVAPQPVVWADTGLPVGDAALVAQARANGAGAGVPGSPTNPLYMREAQTPPPGATYVDAQGTHVAPGTFQAPSAAPPASALALHGPSAPAGQSPPISPKPPPQPGPEPSTATARAFLISSSNLS